MHCIFWKFLVVSTENKFLFEDSFNVLFVRIIFLWFSYDFYYGILVERIFLWFLWFFTCHICGNGFCSFLFQSLMVFMVFMIFMILNFLFIFNSMNVGQVVWMGLNIVPIAMWHSSGQRRDWWIAGHVTTILLCDWSSSYHCVEHCIVVSDCVSIMIVFCPTVDSDDSNTLLQSW